MDEIQIINKLFKSLELVRKKNVPACDNAISYSENGKKYSNQFIIMIKPECLYSRNENTKEIIKLLINNLIKSNIEIGAAFSMNGRYIAQNSIIENQYFMLNKYAHLGLGSVPLNTVRNLESRVEKVNVIGAFNFLELYSDHFDEALLERIAHKNGSEKLGNGLYLLHLIHDNIPYGIINAFHPYQKKHFCNENSNLILLECYSNQPYWKLDEEIIGNFKPSDARENSIRSMLFRNQEKLGITINTMFNGVHVSPSPLEGLKALQLYFKGIDIIDTNLGNQLVELGFNYNQIQNLLNNPYVIEGNKHVTLFDKVEGRDTEEILEYLSKEKMFTVL
ncbi:hypothetical protein [Listeria seeligeri]|uniref:hypothetical protein n=1 Tax=Listeria seeligeri TaxID=1640 RepID=UPI0022EBFDD8|nr:hypothetical protein [Listeria seeligeri]